MQSQKVDPAPAGLRAVVFRKHRPLQESTYLRRKITIRAGLDQLAQSAHRLRIALVSRPFGA